MPFTPYLVSRWRWSGIDETNGKWLFYPHSPWIERKVYRFAPGIVSVLVPILLTSLQWPNFLMTLPLLICHESLSLQLPTIFIPIFKVIGLSFVYNFFWIGHNIKLAESQASYLQTIISLLRKPNLQAEALPGGSIKYPWASAEGLHCRTHKTTPNRTPNIVEKCIFEGRFPKVSQCFFTFWFRFFVPLVLNRTISLLCRLFCWYSRLLIFYKNLNDARFSWNFFR